MKGLAEELHSEASDTGRQGCSPFVRPMEYEPLQCTVIGHHLSTPRLFVCMYH